MAVVLEAITHVFVSGRTIEPGTLFSTDEAYATKLIKGGSAKVKEAISTQPKEELLKAFMALKLDELKALAAKNNVSLEATTKAEITEQLIEAGVVIE